jgi:pimeloyl-ACP methyl ester carboxylesterase
MVLRSFLILCAVLVIYAEVPFATAQENIKTEAPPPLGRMFDLGGYKLHLNCTGAGQPTVVLSAGAGDFSTDWALVQNKVAAFTRVCSYDRSGAAWSDLGPKPRTLDQEAFDLYRLLAATGEQGPYIMVGHSLGGMVARIFTEQHAKVVAGVVLVDAYSEDSRLNVRGKIQRMRLMAKDRTIPDPKTRVTDTDGITSAELQRINDFIKQFVSTPKIEAPFDKLPEQAQQIRLWALQQPKYYAQDDDYLAEISARMYAENQKHAHPLGSVPLIVLTRDKYDYPGPDAASFVKEHKEQQAAMTKLSTHSTQIIVPKSGHHIHLDVPDEVVAAIRRVIQMRE